MEHKINDKQIVLKLLVILFSIQLVAGGKPAAAQSKSNETDDLMGQLVQKCLGADKKGIVVMDLEPALGQPGPFGPWLANRFASSLAGQDATVEVIDRQRIGTALGAQHLSVDTEFDVMKAVALGKSIGGTTVVVGSYGAAEKGLGISLAAFRVSEYGIAQSTKFLIGMVFGKIPITDEVSAHLNVTLNSLRPKDGVYRSGIGGVNIPTCIKCPAPASMRAPDIDLLGMLRAHPQGATVWLRFVVTAEGHTKDVVAFQPVGYGFDEQYVKAAKEWEFKPAVDADNHPVSVNYAFHFSFNFK